MIGCEASHERLRMRMGQLWSGTMHVSICQLEGLGDTLFLLSIMLDDDVWDGATHGSDQLEAHVHTQACDRGGHAHTCMP